MTCTCANSGGVTWCFRKDTCTFLSENLWECMYVFVTKCTCPYVSASMCKCTYSSDPLSNPFFVSTEADFAQA